MRGRGGADGRHHRDRTWPERSTCRRTCPTFGGLRIPLVLTRIRRLHGRRSGAFTARVRSWVVVVVVGRVKARHALPILILRLRPIPIPIPRPSHIPDHAEGTRVVEPSLRLSMFPEPSPCRRRPNLRLRRNRAASALLSEESYRKDSVYTILLREGSPFRVVLFNSVSQIYVSIDLEI